MDIQPGVPNTPSVSYINEKGTNQGTKFIVTNNQILYQICKYIM